MTVATRLSDLKVDFVSLVDRPAHPDARVLMTKRDEVEKAPKTWSQSMRDRAEEAGHTMPGGGYPIENMADLHRAMQAYGRAKNPAATKAWILRRAKALGASQDVVDRIQAFKRLEEPMADVVKLEDLPQEVQDYIGQAELAKADADEEITNLKARLTQLEADLADAREERDDEGEGNEGVDKSDLPEPVRKRLEELEAQRAVDAERIEKMEEAARVRDHIAKAEAYTHIAKADELGPVLAEIAKHAPTAYERVEHYFKTAEERIKAGDLTEEQGWNGGAESAASEKVDALATELTKADKTLSKPQAIAKVLSEHPELYVEYRAERK